MLLQYIKSNFVDAGELVDTTALANTGVAYTEWLDAVHWVRRLRMLVQCDEQYTLQYVLADKVGTESTTVEIVTAQAALTPSVKQVETATVVGTITTSGNAKVSVDSINFGVDSPKIVAVPVQSGVLQAETATVVGTVTTSGNASTVVTASGMGNSPKTVTTAVVAGTLQVETATVAGTITTAGNASVIVTAAGLAGSPITVTVALAESDNADAMATKIRTALGLNAPIAAFFTISGATDKVILTTKTKTANDSTLNIALADGTCVGITAAPSSDDTTAGVTPDTASLIAGKIRTALGLDADVSAFFTITGATDKIILTAKTKAANDTTMNIANANGTSVGITTVAASTNTPAGVAPDDASAIGGKIRTALTNNTYIDAYFVVSGATDQVVLTSKQYAGNDTSINIAIEDDTSAGITDDTTSTHTIAGVGSGTWRTHYLELSPGYGLKLGIKNTSGGAAADVARMYVTLMGE